MKRSKFIVIEGGEGSGKSTVIHYLKNNLPRSKFVFTREPGGTEVGHKIREILLSGKKEKLDALTELLLFSADRRDHLEKIILPALRGGKNVICDRFNLSTMAYQIYGRNRKDLLRTFSALNSIVVGRNEPSLVIFLDLDPKIGLSRVSSRGEEVTRFEKEKVDFHKRIRSGFLKEIKKYNHKIIDASRPKREVAKKTFAAVKKATG